MNSSKKKKKANEFSGQYKNIPEQQLCQTSKGFCLHWGNRLEAPGKISRERKQRTDQYPDTSKCNEKKFTFLFFFKENSKTIIVNDQKYSGGKHSRKLKA